MKKIGFSGLALLFCIYVYSMDTIKISRSDLKTNHLEHIHMYVVSNTNTEPVESIIKKQDLFRPIPASDLNFGIANNDYWFSFCLTNTSDTFRIMILSIKNPMLNHIQLYERSSCHIIKSITTGEMYPFSSRDIWNRFFLFRIELKPGETKQIFFKVANNGDSVFIPISLETEKTAFNEVEKDYLFNTFYYGFFLFLLVFNLLLLLTLKNKIFLSYMLYITCTLFFFMNNDGLSFQLFWPDSPWWGNQSFNIFIGIGGYYFLVFTQKFFDTRKNFPAMHTVIMVIRVLQLILVPFFFVSYPLFLHFSLILSFFTPVGFMITIVLAIIAIRRNMLFAKYVLVAYSVWLVGTLVYIARDTGFLPEQFFINNSVKIGFLIEGLILMAALIKRTKDEWDNSTKALEEKNRELVYLSTVASESENGIAIIDPNGTIEWSNNRFIQMHALRDQQNIPIENVFQLPDIRQKLAECNTQRDAVTFEYNVNYGNTDKSSHWLLITLSPRILIGGLNHFVAIETNITKIKQYESELKKAKEKAEESDRLKSAFLANISHEIRTPMNAILGFSGLLAIPTYSEEKRNFFCRIIEARTMDLLRIINDLMDISKLDVGQMKIFETNGNLSETFNQLQSYYESALETIEGKHDIQIIPRYNISPGNSLITTDFVRLNQILTNLIDNAIKFTSNGSVEYGCSIQGDRLEFYVKDTGIGIPADKMSIIFERFRQADETTTRLFGGSGLGLAISKGLLSLMNGDIRVESEENKGSTFRFSLPYKPARIIAEETSDEKKVSYNWERNKLLIIEDDFANIKYITEILSDKKCRHSFAKSGSDALMYLKENPGTDLILLDIRLPDMNGVTLAKTISDTYKNIRIIAQTAFATQNDRMACLNAGCIDYISKPYSQKALTEIIEKHLR